MNIEVGKTYNYFDDGKISESRRYVATITEIIPFDQIDEETFNHWREEVQECDFLFAKETDYFVKGFIKYPHSNDEAIEVCFVRTINNGWFSMGWEGGRLDVDGSLSKELLTNR